MEGGEELRKETQEERDRGGMKGSDRNEKRKTERGRTEGGQRRNDEEKRMG